MTKKYRTSLSVIISIMFLFQLLYPISISAETVEKEAKLQLFQVNDRIDIDETISIETDTYLYGYLEEEEVVIQFGDTYISVPSSNVKKVDVNEESPIAHVDYKNLESELKHLPKDLFLYSIKPDQKIRAELNDQLEYSVYINEYGLEVIYIGNIEFYLNQEDRNVAEQKLSTLEEDNDNPEDGENIEEINENKESDKEVEESNNDVTSELIEDKKEEEEVTDSSDKEQEMVDSEENLKDNLGEEAEKQEENLNSSDNEPQSKSKVQSVTSSNVDPWEGVTSDYFKVVEDELTVYDNRGGSLKPIGKLKKDQIYPRVRDYGNWHRIQYGDIYGYVLKVNTVPADGSSIKNENTKYINQSRHFTALNDVNVYDNTSGSLVPFGKINKGQNYPVVSDYGNWWRVIYSDRVGYVRKSEVEIQFTYEDKYFKADRNIAIYDNRSGSLKKVGELKKGQSYSRVSDYGNWHRIKFGNYYGYVRKSETSHSTGEDINNLNTNYTNQARTFTTLESVTVYDNSSGSLQPFGEIEQGVKFSISTDYGNWWRIIFADRVGYVRKSEVQAQFLNNDNYFRALKEQLPVYDNRSGSLEKVGELRKGQSYSILRDYGNWWRVQFGDIYGYVRKSDTGYATKEEIPNLNSRFTNSKSKFITKDNVVVYDNSSGSLIPFGELEEGIVYPIATDYGNWWRVIYLDRVGYVRKSEVEIFGVEKTKYDISLSEAVDIQMKANPQTDKEYDTFVSKSYIKNGKVTASTLNVRGGPSTSYWIVGQLKEGAKVTIINEVNGWYQIEFTNSRQWVNASPEDIEYYLNPNNFINDERQQFQFLDLARSSDATASTLNKFLLGKGILEGKGQAFIDASRVNGVNDIYLVSHALLETGNGTSTLANGVEYKGEIVYNMYGIGANDGCAITCGAAKAYKEGWTTPYKAIVGGAQFIGNEYIKSGQNTLYKMRWNPASMSKNGYASHQYATDIGWASKQIYTMYNLYKQLDSYTLYLDIPEYN